MAGTGKIKVSFRQQAPQYLKNGRSFYKSEWLFDDIEEAIGQMMGILSSENTDDILSLEMTVEGE